MNLTSFADRLQVDTRVAIMRNEPAAALDAGYLAHETLRDLRATLEPAAAFRQACLRQVGKKPSRASRVPDYFSFVVSDSAHPERPKLGPAWFDAAQTISNERPELAAAWQALDGACQQALRLLLRSREARQVARSIAGLMSLVTELAADQPHVRVIQDLLAIPDDLVCLVLHPQTHQGWRIRLSGIEDHHHLLACLIMQIGGPLGLHVPPEVQEAYAPTAAVTQPVVARFPVGLYGAGAIRRDGTLQLGLAGCDHWLWGERSPATIPVREGQRIIVLAEPPFHNEWEIQRRFPELCGSVEMLELLPTEEVSYWLRCQGQVNRPRAA